MLPEEKIKEVKRSLRKGVPEGEIKEILKKEGYSEEEIKLLFKPHDYDMRTWYLVFGVITFLLGLYILITKGGWLILILSIFLFIAYHYEEKRLERLKK